MTANGGGAAVTPVTSANASPIIARAATTATDQTDNLLEPPGTHLERKNYNNLTKIQRKKKHFFVIELFSCFKFVYFSELK